MADPKLDSGKRNVASAAPSARDLGKGVEGKLVYWKSSDMKQSL